MQGFRSARSEIALLRKELTVAHRWIESGMPGSQEAKDNYFHLHRRLLRLMTLRQTERKFIRAGNYRQARLFACPDTVLEICIARVKTGNANPKTKARALLALTHALRYVRACALDGDGVQWYT